MSTKASAQPGWPLADAVGPAAERLSPRDEDRAFWRLRLRLARNMAREMLTRMRFRLTLIVVLTGLLWVGMFWMFLDGFAFLEHGIRHPETLDQTIRAVFSMFFASLMVMLVFSSAIILYGSLFRSPEVTFLLTSPVRVERIFLHKFQEAIVLSSWGCVLLGSPMLLAYGVVAEAPWYYYVLLLPFLLAFVYLPATLGAVACLLIARWLPGRQNVVLVAVAAAILGGVAAMGWWLWTGPENDLLTAGWFQEMLGRLRYCEQRLLPNWWLSSGLLETARGAWSEGLLFLVVLIANGLLGRQVCTWVGGQTYRPAYNALFNRRGGRKRSRAGWFEALLGRLSAGLSGQMRLLLVKDARLFRRDPVQWTQFLIFFGLLALYFLNIRRFSYDRHYTGWVNMVSFLNLSVVGLLMSTFTTRFIFPMISLEGQRFWILGLLPLKRETILWGKFLFAAGGSIAPCAGLVLLSDVMLGVAPLILLVHQLTCVVLCVGLAGIAVGLGARLPNFREQSPSRIAAGFGGTLNLVVSTLYILAIVLLTAVPSHFYLVAQAAGESRMLDDMALPDRRWLEFYLTSGVIGSLVLGAIATAVPLWIGFRAFRRIEF